MNPPTPVSPDTLGVASRFAAVLTAAAIAVALTSLLGWSFVDSTRIARWIEPAPVGQTLPARVVL